jgi:hypothetical protein
MAKLHEIFTDPTYGVSHTSFSGQHVSGEVQGSENLNEAGIEGDVEGVPALGGSVSAPDTTGAAQDYSIIGDPKPDDDNQGNEDGDQVQSGSGQT